MIWGYPYFGNTSETPISTSQFSSISPSPYGITRAHNVACTASRSGINNSSNVLDPRTVLHSRHQLDDGEEVRLSRIHSNMLYVSYSLICNILDSHLIKCCKQPIGPIMIINYKTSSNHNRLLRDWQYIIRIYGTSIKMWAAFVKWWFFRFVCFPFD